MNKDSNGAPMKHTAEIIDAAWQALLDSLKELPGTDTMQDVMSVVCRGARNVCGADGITFVLREGDLCHYMDEDAIGPLWKGKRFPLSACISGWCMLNRQTAVVPDIYKDSRIPHDVYRPTFVKTLIMVPVRLEDPIAAIGAYWATEQTPTTHMVTMFEALARCTSSAIVTAREFNPA